jgi:hypothetical protein
LHGTLTEDGRRRDDAIRAYLAAQFDDDKEVKFKQVDLYNSLLDLFIDVPIRYLASHDQHSSRRWVPATRFVRTIDDDVYVEEKVTGAADLLLTSYALFEAPCIVLEGAPGQGKSTITQYVCQTQRMRLLDYSADLWRIPDSHRQGEVRLPFRVDLRDYASWLGGSDPFAADPKATRPTDSTVSLESFLAYQVSHLSGGHNFSVSDLSAIARSSYILIVLDGFDEVANVQSREQVVNEISKSVTRLSTSARALQVIVTSRPAAFANSPGFPEKNWHHFSLDALTNLIVNEYAEKWMKARSLSYKDAADFRLVLSQKLDQPHMRDLARNPMQLAILLNLIQTRGLSLPDKRTALYDSYMELFFSREAEKSTIVREHRDLLVDLHRFLAWVIHTEAETSKGKGSITEERLKVLLKNYLDEEGHPTELVDELFTGMVERVVALVSRIQGTFEFEVQPLREYFAARHLYDTAPYSPPGNEKKGTKPERFDALAANFYWLNVTRFFCGCFSRGELSSLADGLESLSNSSSLKDISYPKLLALMLLGDWVFAQQPLIVSRVAQLVISRLSFRNVLASMIRDRGGVSLVLPERCGKVEVVGAAKSAFLESGHRDEELAVASVIREALSSKEIFDYWKGLKPDPANERWINQGAMLGVYRTLPKEELLGLFREFGPAMVSHLAAEDRFDVIESDNDMFTEAVRMALRRGGRVLIPRIVGGETAHFISHLGFALDLSIYFSALGSQARYSPVFHQIGHRRYYYSPRRFASAESIKGFIDDGMISRIETFLNVFTELSDQSTSSWSTTLTPWSRLVEAGLREFGKGPIFSEIASIGAGIRSKSDLGRIGDNLFDETVSLCERSRYARLRSGSPKWWLDQLDLADEQSKIELALINLFAWGTTRTIAQLLGKLSQLLNNLDDTQFRHLMNIAGRSGVSDKPTFKANEFAREMKEASPRALALLVRRAHKSDAEIIFERSLRSYNGDDNEILSMVAELALLRAVENPEEWKIALPIVRRAYQRDAVRDVSFAIRAAERTVIPTPVAQEIARELNHYPLHLIGLADGSLTKILGSAAKPIGEVARSEDWFGVGRLKSGVLGGEAGYLT